MMHSYLVGILVSNFSGSLQLCDQALPDFWVQKELILVLPEKVQRLVEVQLLDVRHHRLQ